MSSGFIERALARTSSLPIAKSVFSTYVETIETKLSLSFSVRYFIFGVYCSPFCLLEQFRDLAAHRDGFEFTHSLLMENGVSQDVTLFKGLDDRIRERGWIGRRNQIDPRCTGIHEFSNASGITSDQG
jgi:hypothetical protein